MSVKKEKIIREIAAELNKSLSDAEGIYSTIVSEMITQLGKGNTVKLSGFGTFQVVNRQPKLGRNPRTGDRLFIPNHKSIKFKMGKNLLSGLNSNNGR